MRFLLLTLLIATACDSPVDLANSSGAPATSVAPQETALCGIGLAVESSHVVATVNGAEITCAEVYKNDKERIELLQSKYLEAVAKLHQAALNEAIDNQLLEGEAKAQNKTLPELIRSQVVAPSATETEVQAFHAAAIARGEKLPGYEQVKDELTTFLNERSQKQALEAYRKTLRKKATITQDRPRSN